MFLDEDEIGGINKLKERIDRQDNNENDGIEGNNSYAIYRMKDNYLKMYSAYILKKETRKLQREAGLDNTNTKKFGHIVNTMSKEMNTSGIDEWLNEKGGQERIDRMDVRAGHQVINDFEKKYGAKRAVKAKETREKGKKPGRRGFDK